MGEMEGGEKWFSDEYEAAAERFRTRGPLGVTAADHKAVGSSPDRRLIEHPGQTLVQILSLDEITNFLIKEITGLKQIHNPPSDPEEAQKVDDSSRNAIRGVVATKVEEMRVSLTYLKELDKLPPVFEKISFEGVPENEIGKLLKNIEIK